MFTQAAIIASCIVVKLRCGFILLTLASKLNRLDLNHPVKIVAKWHGLKQVFFLVLLIVSIGTSYLGKEIISRRFRFFSINK